MLARPLGRTLLPGVLTTRYIQPELMPILLQYADRLPIGLERIIKTVPASTVRAFYQRWYRPEHMAVFCVGDFDSPDAVVEQIRTALGQVQGSADELAEPIPRCVLRIVNAPP